MIEQVIRIAQQAGAEILRYYNQYEIQVTTKEDNSPLTNADLASDRIIRNELTSRYDIPCLSEEAVIDFEARKTWTRFWLIDPLDGTKEFINKIGEFTVNIALIDNGKPVLGVIYCPAKNETYYAAVGFGAWYEKNGELLHLPCTKPSRKIIATGSRFHLSQVDKAFNEANNITDMIQVGSSLKFGLVASGKATLYVRFQGSMEWDIAAGHCIVKEAGCMIRDLATGKEPEYNKESLVNNYFIVCNTQKLFSALKFPEK